MVVPMLWDLVLDTGVAGKVTYINACMHAHNGSTGCLEARPVNRTTGIIIA
jgi:hypothetical protein